jgi:competence protein ComEC
MGLGIDLMVATGKWVASWPGAVSVLPANLRDGASAYGAGGLWICLWRTRARALGLVIAALGLALAPGANGRTY